MLSHLTSDPTLKVDLESIKALFGLPEDAPYYAMLFGVPKAAYARTTQREGTATIQRLTDAT